MRTPESLKSTILDLLRGSGLPVLVATEGERSAEGTIGGAPFKASWRPRDFVPYFVLWLTVGREQVVTGAAREPEAMRIELAVKHYHEAQAQKLAEVRQAGITGEVRAVLGLLPSLTLLGDGRGAVPADALDLLRRAVEFSLEQGFARAEDRQRQEAAGPEAPSSAERARP